MSEMRVFLRYPVRAPVFFTWSDVKSQVRRGEGVTRDISLRGVYIWSEQGPPPGVVVQMEVLLPRLEEKAPGLRIEGRCHVTRAESRSDNGLQTGFGFCSENFLLRSLDEQLLLDGEEGQVN